MKLIIGCDNNGFSLKNEIIKMLINDSFEIVDIGVNDPADLTFYPYIAEQAALKVAQSEGNAKGILICGTGLGMAMTANKVKGIRAGVCHDCYSAERLALSNNGNILCLGALVIGKMTALRIVEKWIHLEYKDCPSTKKIEAIREIEKKYMI